MRVLGYAIVGLAVAGSLAGCNGKKKQEEAARQAADSMAALRAAGKTDLSNPEMGAKVLVKLSEDSVWVSHTEIPQGQVTFAVENHGGQPHIAEVKGPGSDIKSMNIRPSETVLMAVILDPGDFEVLCADTVGPKKGCGRSWHVKVKAVGPLAEPEYKQVTPASKDTAKAK